MGDHWLTLIAYCGVGELSGWWFWRSQSGVVGRGRHAAASMIFGMLWPVSFIWRACVRFVNRVFAERRARRVKSVDRSPDRR